MTASVTHTDASHTIAAARPTFVVLILTNLAMGIAPVITNLQPRNVWLGILVASLPFVAWVPLLLLSFWVGMGTSRCSVRVLGGLLGDAYLAIWPTLAGLFVPWLSSEPRGPWILQEYVDRWFVSCGIVFVGAGVLLLIRRRFVVLQLLSESVAVPQPRTQYSILFLLVVTAATAMILGLMRTVASGGPEAHMAIDALMPVVFLVNATHAVGTTLSERPISLAQMAIVFVVAILLGVGLVLTVPRPSSPDRLAWWSPPILAATLPVVMIVGSLLAVRSCGYRLVSKRSEQSL